MLSVKLSEPRPKKRRRGLKPKQTFPVPISSLTGIDAADDLWRWYDASFVGNDDSEVRVTDADSVKMLSTLGYFGEVRKLGQEVERFVAVEDFDPVPPTVCSVDDSDGGDQDDAKGEELSSHEDSSSEDVVDDDVAAEVEAVTKPTSKSWSSWKSAASCDDEDEVLILDPFETFFLTFSIGCLRVTRNGDFCSIDELWSVFSENDANFRRRYAAYHHFRSKNWIVRNGVKFGNDFLLYKDGPPFYHASYSVRVRNDRNSLSWSELSALIRVTESAAKELLVVEVLENVSDVERDLTAAEYLKSVVVREVLVKRWVASQKREDGAAV